MNDKELDEITQRLMDNCRKAVEEKREVYYGHIIGCDICRCFQGYQSMDEAMNGMKLHPRRHMEGMDDYWEEHKEHLKEYGKFKHTPFKLLPLITEIPSESKDA